jgi:plastocyanin
MWQVPYDSGAMSLRCGMFVLIAGLAACEQRAPPPATVVPAATSSEVTGIVPKNAIVTLLPASGAPPMPAEPAVLDQIAKQFLPRTLIVRVGQRVEFRNSEDMPHNVSVMRRESGTEVFNVGTEPHQTYAHTFDRVGQFDVTCDIHEGMEATLIVARGPTTTIAEDDGRFSFPNVAFGSYTLSLTYSGQTVEQAVEVRGARTEIKPAR